MINPAFRTFPITNAPPVLEFGSDFHRQPGPRIDPGDLMILGRAGAHINLVGFQADKTRDLQSAAASAVGCRFCRKAPAGRGQNYQNGNYCQAAWIGRIVCRHGRTQLAYSLKSLRELVPDRSSVREGRNHFPMPVSTALISSM